ncbi:MAG: prepilin-type N-terminal cleavage/methylation domain-containing protein [Candidatus Omnitrophota bacterium]
MMKKIREGFTLVELMIVSAISAIIMFGVFGILQASNKQLETIHTKMSLEESLREALFKMAQEIRQTAYYEIQDIGDGNLSGTPIRFRIPVPDPDPLTLVDDNYQPAWSHVIRYRRGPHTNVDINDPCKAIDDIINSCGENQLCRDDCTTGKTAVLANDIVAVDDPANDVWGLKFSRSSSGSGFVTITASVQKELADGRLIPEDPKKPIQITMQVDARNTAS